jgi:hypothetical protein
MNSLGCDAGALRIGFDGDQASYPPLEAIYVSHRNGSVNDPFDDSITSTALVSFNLRASTTDIRVLIPSACLSQLSTTAENE